ncbi:hypothetical protein [Thauera sp.]|uniref:hypothetical protein n=1 Tax=Thauera sp. TaxID=1905334 RepID=UPI0039E42137
MKTWTKVLVATGVIAMHALGFAAGIQPRDGTLQQGLLVAQATEAEWLLPEIVVTASAERTRKERNSRHSARHGGDCRFHCNDGIRPVGAHHRT